MLHLFFTFLVLDEAIAHIFFRQNAVTKTLISNAVLSKKTNLEMGKMTPQGNKAN
jgi:hypothetical protein